MTTFLFAAGTGNGLGTGGTLAAWAKWFGKELKWKNKSG
eukprot:CAMPEP_0197666016 /NCGR_PEP_ID=MMETSP1338-20131121/61231_1 /TAXON_ID=43686 ORGANISM="Pelagodinium beii, Strain RCC1491" /NCGR_SAMPLE_ID=MMETSP1338 /ASSEMBLY_ACC=CAM_ASM_000754 /LENGTH=38 /DNA_ID= /DNA_START= /DNA_END= /DNA_ORIENTATION=